MDVVCTLMLFLPLRHLYSWREESHPRPAFALIVECFVSSAAVACVEFVLHLSYIVFAEGIIVL